MLTLLLCSSLWQFEAPQATDEAALASPHANGLALTPAQPDSPSLRDHISSQLSEAWLARKPSVSVTLEEKKSPIRRTRCWKSHAGGRTKGGMPG